MGRINTPILTESSRTELETLFKNNSNYSFRKRCQTILLKADGRHSKDVGSIVGMSHVSVNSWLKRYKIDGVLGLKIKSGRGRKPIIDRLIDESAILEAAKKHRQRLQTAKAEWEESAGKEVSRETFRRFLKSLAVDISV